VTASCVPASGGNSCLSFCCSGSLTRSRLPARTGPGRWPRATSHSAAFMPAGFTGANPNSPESTRRIVERSGRN
jgi:hypothetical protein